MRPERGERVPERPRITSPTCTLATRRSSGYGSNPIGSGLTYPLRTGRETSGGSAGSQQMAGGASSPQPAELGTARSVPAPALVARGRLSGPLVASPGARHILVTY